MGAAGCGEHAGGYVGLPAAGSTAVPERDPGEHQYDGGAVGAVPGSRGRGKRKRKRKTRRGRGQEENRVL